MMAGNKVIGSQLTEFGCNIFADLRAILASGVELAPLRRFHRTGNVTLQHHQLAVIIDVGGGNGGKQSLGVGMHGMIKQLLRIAQLHHVAEIHNANTVGDVFDNRKIVSDKEISQIVLFLQILKQVDNLRLNGNVQSRNSLVADDKLRIRGKRTRNTDSLALSAGELVREAVNEIGRQSAHLHDFQNTILHSRTVFAEILVSQHTLADNLTDGHSWIEGGIRILENQLQLAAEAAHFLLGKSGEVDAVVAVYLIFLEIRVILVSRADLVDLSLRLGKSGSLLGDLPVDLSRQAACGVQPNGLWRS